MSALDRLSAAWRALSGAPATAPRAASQMTAGIEIDLKNPEQIRALLGGFDTNSGVPVSRESALKVAVAYRCRALLCGAAATTPFHVKRRDSDRVRQEVAEHPVAELWRIKPNDWQTPAEFKKFIAASVLDHGNGYAIIVRRQYGDKRPTALLPLDPLRVDVKRTIDGSLAYRHTSDAGQVTEIAAADMFHLRGPSFDGVKGLGVLAAARESLGVSLASQRHLASTLRNGATASGMLLHKGNITEPAMQRLRAQVDEFRGGGAQSGGTLLLEEDMKYEKIGFSLADLQFIQTQENTALDICMYYGVPPHMVGLTSKQTSWGSGIEQQTIGFVNFRLVDFLNDIKEAIERCLMTRDDRASGLYAHFDLRGLLRGDLKARAAYYKTRFETGSMSPNDIRAAEDENPRDGGDEYFVAMNMGGEPNPTPDPDRIEQE